jgi:hypothetical protein
MIALLPDGKAILIRQAADAAVAVAVDAAASTTCQSERRVASRHIIAPGGAYSSRNASIGWMASPRRAGPSAASKPTTVLIAMTIGTISFELARSNS